MSSKIEGAHMRHVFLVLLAASADHNSILFFQATAAVQCFTPTLIIPLIPHVKQPSSALVQQCFKNIKKLPAKYHVHNTVWMTMVIFSSFLLSLNATMGAQKRKIVLFVNNCATQTQDASFLRNVKVKHYPTNCKVSSSCIIQE